MTKADHRNRFLLLIIAMILTASGIAGLIAPPYGQITGMVPNRPHRSTTAAQSGMAPAAWAIPQAMSHAERGATSNAAPPSRSIAFCTASDFLASSTKALPEA